MCNGSRAYIVVSTKQVLKIQTLTT